MKKLIMSAMVLLMLVTALAGCGSPAQDEENKTSAPVTSLQGSDKKYIMVFSEDVKETSGQCSAVLYRLGEEDELASAEYAEDIRSFSFLVEENGLYVVKILKEGQPIKEHTVKVDDQTSFYMMYMDN